MNGRAPALLRELALTLGAVAGVLCVVFTLLGALVGVRPLVFTSGSMAPSIETGDLAVTRPVPVDELAVGDVVSVFDAQETRVTHRVILVEGRRLWLKGDANATPDPLPYLADQVDRVLFSVPAGGYVLTWLASPVATMLLGAYLVFVVWVLWPRSHSSCSAAAGLVVVVALVGFTPSPEPTTAAWTDAVPLTGTSVTAYTVPKPVITGCTADLLGITVRWTGVTSPYALNYQAVVAETGTSLPVSASGTTRTARYTTALAGSTGATQTIQITAVLPQASSWTSVPARQTVRLGLLGAAPTCGTAS